MSRALEVLQALHAKGLLSAADVSTTEQRDSEALGFGDDADFHEALNAYVEVCADVKV